jgi:two-component system LytT family response regulator
MPIRALIVDDEASARSRLAKLLAPYPRVTIVGEALNGMDAVAAVTDLKPDLVFLDVQMPGLNGFEVLRALPAGAMWPLVIFATAFDHYAMAAFDANAVAYLLKPINRDRLATALERVERLLGQPGGATAEREKIQTLATFTSDFRQIVCRQRDRYVLIPLDEICFVRVEDEMTKVKTATAVYRTDYVLNDLEARLPSPPFFRAHRSVIVNAKMIKEIAPLIKGTFLLVMKDRELSEIQVSERQSRVVRELLHGL